MKQRVTRRAREPDRVKAWRSRMASAAGKAVFARRKLIELTNARLKQRGLGRLLVRGLAKVQAVAVLHALAHNLLTAQRLRAAG